MKLSPEELNYLLDQDFLRTKVKITDKLIDQLSDIQQAIKGYLLPQNLPFPQGTDLNDGKISKGERYKDLPYLVLDFPKLIQKERIFVLRTMIWWGNEFSTSLHLQGEIWETLRTAFLRNYSGLKGKEVYFCVAENPWEYHFDADNYRKLDEISIQEIESRISKANFLKISRKTSLSNPETWKDFSLESLRLFLSVIFQ